MLRVSRPDSFWQRCNIMMAIPMTYFPEHCGCNRDHGPWKGSKKISLWPMQYIHWPILLHESSQVPFGDVR